MVSRCTVTFRLVWLIFSIASQVSLGKGENMFKGLDSVTGCEVLQLFLWPLKSCSA